MTTLTDATAGVLAWAYDDAARTKTQTNRTDPTPLTPTITWTSDAASRVISRAYLDDAGASRTTTYTYDLTGALATATDGTSTITITPDRLGRPVTVTVSNDPAATTTYGYSFTAPTRSDASGATTMAVDPYGRVTSLTDLNRSVETPPIGLHSVRLVRLGQAVTHGPPRTARRMLAR